MHSLFIATPAYGIGLTVPYTVSLLKTVMHFVARGGTVAPSFCGGDLLAARNALVARFMASGRSRLLFIDSDIGWSVEAVERLLAHSDMVEFVCGVYPKKKTPREWPCSFLGREVSGMGGLAELRHAPAGFMMLTRAAVKCMMDAYPELRCELFDDTPEAERPYTYALFGCEVAEGRYLREDFAFCERWRRIGGRIWVDPEIDLQHYGDHCYTGRLADVLKPRC